jgi:hypothetical protein
MADHVDLNQLREAFIRKSIASMPANTWKQLGGAEAQRQWHASANFFFEQLLDYLHSNGLEIAPQWRALVQ